MLPGQRMVVTAVVFLWSTTVTAQTPQRHVEELEVGSVSQQMALDVTSIGYGDGAIFVPSRSRPELEPQVRVLWGDTVIARGPTGRRLPVPAGSYRVMIGQGPADWRATTTAVVQAGETTVVDDFFGSIRVTAVDPRGEPVAVRYTLVSADGYRMYGPTITSGNDVYEATRTWILAPGSYRIFPGGSPTGTTGTMATVVSSDQRARVRLLVDGEGEVVGSESGDYEAILSRSDWRFNWVVGGSGSFGQSSGQLNGFGGDSIRLELFSDLRVTFDRRPNLLRFAFGVEEGWVGFTRPFGRDLPFQKLDDFLRASLEYTFRASRIAGPYVRASLRTSILPNIVTSDRDYEIITTASDGSETTSQLAEAEEITLLDNFSPLIMQEGAGVSVTLWESRIFRLGLSSGIAARQAIYNREACYLTAREGDTLRLQELEDSFDWGPEANAWLRVRLGSWVVLRFEAESFVPMDAVLSSDQVFRLLFQGTGTASLRLTGWASLVYSATLHRDDAAIEELQFRHSLNLRFQHSIF